MKPSEALNVHRAGLRQILSRYGLRNPRVFGSVLTHTDDEESDLDLLVDRGEKTSLLDLGGAEYEAEQLTGVKVSVLTPGFLSPKFRDKVLQTAQPL